MGMLCYWKQELIACNMPTEEDLSCNVEKQNTLSIHNSMGDEVGDKTSS